MAHDVDPLEHRVDAGRGQAHRHRGDGEDLVSKLVNRIPEDGIPLSPEHFDNYFLLLVVAGNETTRNSITHGMIAFAEHPDQWELYKRERPATAVDEIVRWATPVTSFQRTALTDYELSGVPMTVLRGLEGWRTSYRKEAEKSPTHTHIDSTQFSHPIAPTTDEINRLAEDFKQFLLAVMLGVLSRSTQLPASGMGTR